MPFYAVAVGITPGVYKTWEECQNQTKGYPKAKFRKFNTESEASNFVKSMSSQNEKIAYNTFVSTSKPLLIENLKPPELKAVSKYSSPTLLKQNQLSLIAAKLDTFIEETNKKLKEFSNRLDLIETTITPVNSYTEKRKNDSTDDVKERKSSKKNRRTETSVITEDNETSSSTAVTRSKSQSTNGSEEEVDGPWGWGNSSHPQGFVMDADGYVIVYTDGACSNNGKSRAKAGIGVWFNHNNPFNIAAPVEGNATNNNAEIQAATRAIQQATLAGVTRLNIHTDSMFMINCITAWIKKWKRNNWVTSTGGPVKNKEQLVILDQAIEMMADVKWTHVRGHMGFEGNEYADRLARSGATMY